MLAVTAPTYQQCSFLTQSFLLGWSDNRTPIWGKMIEYSGKNALPRWHDWDDSRARIVAPLCALARQAALFGNEWRVDYPEVIALKHFVTTHFEVQGTLLLTDTPSRLADEPLFWSGGNYFFLIVPVLIFEIDKLSAVLEIMKHHQQAGKMSPRTGGHFTKINRFARSAVKNGEFAIICDGRECEFFYPAAAQSIVESVANEVEGRRLAEASSVKLRMSET